RDKKYTEAVAELVQAVKDNKPNKVAKIFKKNQDRAKELANAVCSDSKWSILCHAAHAGFVEIANMLTTSGAVVNATTPEGETALYLASRSGHVGVVTVLCGAPDIDINLANTRGETSLFVAAALNKTEVVNKLVDQKKICLNQATIDGQTPVFIAAFRDYENVVARLAQAEADVNVSTSEKETPLSVCISNSHENIFDILLGTNKVDTRQLVNDGKTLLSLAVEADNQLFVRALLLCSDVNQLGANELTPLLTAIFHDLFNMADMLLKADGIDKNCKSKDKKTPAHFAAGNGNLSILKLLYDNSVKIDQPDDDRKIPLDYAVDEECRLFLIQNMPKPTPIINTEGIDANKLARSYIIPRSNYQIKYKLGEGGFGAVYSAIHPGWGGVAVKQLHVNMQDGRARDEFFKEVNTMMQLRHPNVVMLYGVCLEQNTFSIVMERMTGSLADFLYIFHGDSTQTPLEVCVDWALNIASGLSYLHYLQILHRDLKAANILFNGKVCKLSDFGISRPIDSATIRGGHVAGTIWWLDPEVLDSDPTSNKSMTFASDVYSFGVTLWEIVSTKTPFSNIAAGITEAAQIERIVQGEREAIPADCDPKIANLIGRCWAQRAEDRPRITEVRNALEVMHKEIEESKYAAKQ
ncbi:MAG: protein kinase, partial [Gammaproteobacteria bacterium]|nr:protein kinase [Gammaproteobacteria bacterium]